MEGESVDTFIERYQSTLARVRLASLISIELSGIGQDGVVVLDSITATDPGKGHMKCAMRALMSLADDLEFDIVTVPRALDDTVDVARLVGWFKRAGFDMEADGNTMRRKVLWSSSYKKS